MEKRDDKGSRDKGSVQSSQCTNSTMVEGGGREGVVLGKVGT